MRDGQEDSGLLQKHSSKFKGIPRCLHIPKQDQTAFVRHNCKAYQALQIQQSGMRLSSFTVYGEISIYKRRQVLNIQEHSFRTLLYGCETWAVTQAQRHDIHVFQMSCLRRICHFFLLERRKSNSILALCKIKSVSLSSAIEDLDG